MSLTGATRSASSPPPARPEKRPRHELSKLEDEVTIEPDALTVGGGEVVTIAATVDASKITGSSKNKKRKQRQKRLIIEPYSADDVLYHDIISLLKNSGKVVEPEKEWDAPLPFGTEVELLVSELSSTGMHF